jgi:predicted TIM-barrel fold metal-dependent hydrolase
MAGAAAVSSDGRDLPIVDAHQHFWDLTRHYYPWLCDPEPIPFRYGDYSDLRRDYLPEDYRRDTRAWRIVKTVHVEAEWDRGDPVAETRWLETVRERHGLPTACVAYCALDRPDAEGVLAAQSASPLVRGIRHKPQTASLPREAKRGKPGSMDDPAWRRGYALLARHGLSFDLQTAWWHLDAAAELARDFPDTQIVINHTALPADRSAEGLSAWRRAIERVAQAPNVAIKISGLGHPPAPWTAQANGPIIRDAVAIFGADRAMFASNYPVDSLIATYDEIILGFLSATNHLSAEDRRKLRCDTAVRIYRLDPEFVIHGSEKQAGRPSEPDGSHREESR